MFKDIDLLTALLWVALVFSGLMLLSNIAKLFLRHMTELMKELGETPNFSLASKFREDMDKEKKKVKDLEAKLKQFEKLHRERVMQLRQAMMEDIDHVRKAYLVFLVSQEKMQADRIKLIEFNNKQLSDAARVIGLLAEEKKAIKEAVETDTSKEDLLFLVNSLISMQEAGIAMHMLANNQLKDRNATQVKLEQDVTKMINDILEKAKFSIDDAENLKEELSETLKTIEK